MWLQWASEHQPRILFNLFLLLGASGVVFAPIAGIRLKRLIRSIRPKYKPGHFLADLLIGYGLQIGCSLLANIDPPKGLASGAVHSPAWFACWYWLGQSCLWFPAIRASWWTFFPNGDIPKHRK